MAGLDTLVDELERSYGELQDRLADPNVYNDHREAAELGRRLKELEASVQAARAWRQASADLADAKGDPELASLASELEGEVARLEDELKLALVERDPADDKDVIVEIRSADPESGIAARQGTVTWTTFRGTSGSVALTWSGDLGTGTAPLDACFFAADVTVTNGEQLSSSDSASTGACLG